MENLLEIIRNRRSPGILVLDFNGRLLFSNREALVLIPEISPSGRPQEGCRIVIPEAILGLLEKLKQSLADGCPQDNEPETSATIVAAGPEQLLSLRAFVIRGNFEANHIMVLAERVVESHGLDYARLKDEFRISSRELEVIKQIHAGLSNHAIACKLFISEHTVKDHLKSIMRKMKVSSRSGIQAALKL